MNRSERDTLRDVMRRVDEVRGLEPGAGPSTTTEPVTAAELLGTLKELATELERSHRRLIETNVQLVSLREVASSLLTTHDADETTAVVTRYLCRAFGFDDGFLLLVNRETLRLEGTWTHMADGRERNIPVAVPLLGDHGAVTRALWLNRTLVHHASTPHVTASLPEGHPLVDTLDGLSGIVCVPLQRSHGMLPNGETHELCGSRCILADVTVLAPPPGAEVLGQPFGARFGPDGEQLLRDTLENGREAQRVETILRTQDGSAVPVRLTTSLLRDERRAVYGAIATFMDQTALKRAEEHAQR